MLARMCRTALALDLIRVTLLAVVCICQVDAHSTHIHGVDGVDVGLKGSSIQMSSGPRRLLANEFYALAVPLAAQLDPAVKLAPQQAPRALNQLPAGYNPKLQLQPTLGSRAELRTATVRRSPQSIQEQLPIAIPASGFISTQQQQAKHEGMPAAAEQQNHAQPISIVPPVTQDPSKGQGSATHAIITVVQQSPAPGAEPHPSAGYDITMFDGTHSTAAPGAHITSHTWVATKLSDKTVVASGSGAMFRFDPHGWQLPAGLYQVGLLVVDDHLGNSIALYDITVGLPQP